MLKMDSKFLPGVTISRMIINNDFVELREKIISKYREKTLLKELNDVNEIDMLFQNAESFYVLYNHPVHEHKDLLSILDKIELFNFIKSCFNEDDGGVDIIVFDVDFNACLAGNHDGELFRVYF